MKIANRFEIGELIGQGSMGEVYRGVEIGTQQPVAIKALKQTSLRGSPESVERFLREGEALRRLNHPNIVKVLESVIEAERHYIVMEFVGGGALDRLIKGEPPPIQRVLEISIDLADALVRAHRLKIIHRDIKPHNVLLAEDGTPRLTDFGVAHISDLSTITQSGALVGTMPYLSPEAWDYNEPDEGTDIWAFGILLYELLCGRRPFEADQPFALKHAITRQPLPDPAQLRPDVPPELADLLRAMLQKEPQQRIQNMRIVGTTLDTIARQIQPGKQIALGQTAAPAAAPAPAVSAAPPAARPELDLTIASTKAGYVVQLRAAQGGAQWQPQPFELPFDITVLPRYRRDLADWVKQARIRRLSANHEHARARDFGAQLFERLFTGDVLNGLRESRAALPHGERLRLRLRLPASLMPIPWEMLFDPQAGQFLALQPDITLLRLAQTPKLLPPLRLDGPLHIVAVLASPSGIEYPPIQVDRELRRLEAVLKGAREHSRITLDVIRGPGTLDQLRARMHSPAHVLHVLCHGDLDAEHGGVLIFEDTDGAPELVRGEMLRTLLQRQPPRLVLLNACLGAIPNDAGSSSIGAALLEANIPAVIAMQFELAEDSALELARVFYAELMAGMPADVALAEGRQALASRYASRLDWAIPVLFLRSESSTLFDIEPPQLTMPTLSLSASIRQEQQARQELQRLWHLAQIAFVTRDWERAAELLEQVAAISPSHEDVQARLAEARRQLIFPPLYRQILALRADDSWQAALELLDQLAREQPGYPDPEGVRAWAERHQRRATRLAAARAASTGADWRTAAGALAALLAEFPDDQEARSLLDHVSSQYQAQHTHDQPRPAAPPQQQKAGPHSDPRARYGLPLEYIERGDFIAALDLLGKILDQQPDNLKAIELLSTLIERPEMPLGQRLRAARLAAHIGDRRPGVVSPEPAWSSPFPAGRYQLGAQPDPIGQATYSPQRVWLDTFQIALYPITVQQFQRFWEDPQGYAQKHWWTPQGWEWKQQLAIRQPYRWGDRSWMWANQPVSGVSWYEAAAFCAWLTQRRSGALLRRSQIVRLPSEAEWEVAATWDPHSHQTRRWAPPAGTLWQNVDESALRTTSPVGIFPEGRSPCGALDMAGNVWEWCSSRYDAYPHESAHRFEDFASNQEGPSLRGGAYSLHDQQSGWAARHWYFPSMHQASFTGFRVVLAARPIWRLGFRT